MKRVRLLTTIHA